METLLINLWLQKPSPMHYPLSLSLPPFPSPVFEKHVSKVAETARRDRGGEVIADAELRRFRGVRGG